MVIGQLIEVVDRRSSERPLNKRHGVFIGLSPVWVMSSAPFVLKAELQHCYRGGRASLSPWYG